MSALHQLQDLSNTLIEKCDSSTIGEFQQCLIKAVVDSKLTNEIKLQMAEIILNQEQLQHVWRVSLDKKTAAAENKSEDNDVIAEYNKIFKELDDRCQQLKIKVQLELDNKLAADETYQIYKRRREAFNNALTNMQAIPKSDVSKKHYDDVITAMTTLIQNIDKAINDHVAITYNKSHQMLLNMIDNSAYRAIPYKNTDTTTTDYEKCMAVLAPHFKEVKKNESGQIVYVKFMDTNHTTDRIIYKELQQVLKHCKHILGYYLTHSINSSNNSLYRALYTIYSYLGFNASINNSCFVLELDETRVQRFYICPKIYETDRESTFTTDPQYPHNVNNF